MRLALFQTILFMILVPMLIFSNEPKSLQLLQSNSFYKMLKNQQTDLDLSFLETYLSEPILYIKEPYEHHEIAKRVFEFVQAAKNQKPFVKELCKELLYQLDSKEIVTKDGQYHSKLYLDEIMSYLTNPDKRVEVVIEKVKSVSDLNAIRPIFERSFRCKELYDNAYLNEEMKQFLKTKEAKSVLEKGESIEELFQKQRNPIQNTQPTWNDFFSFIQEKAMSKTTEIWVAKNASTKAPLGFLWVNKEYPHIYMISYLAKDPQAVHLGIGKKLLTYIKENDPHKYVLQVMPENNSALSLYKSVGFVRHKVRRIVKGQKLPEMIQMIADFRSKDNKDKQALSEGF